MSKKSKQPRNRLHAVNGKAAKAPPAPTPHIIKLPVPAPAPDVDAVTMTAEESNEMRQLDNGILKTQLACGEFVIKNAAFLQQCVNNALAVEAMQQKRDARIREIAAGYGLNSPGAGDWGIDLTSDGPLVFRRAT